MKEKTIFDLEVTIRNMRGVANILGKFHDPHSYSYSDEEVLGSKGEV